MNLEEMLEDGSVKKFRRTCWWPAAFAYFGNLPDMKIFYTNTGKFEDAKQFCMTRDDILANDWEPVVE